MPSDLDARRRSGRRVATLAPRPSQPDGALAPPSPQRSHSPPPPQTELQVCVCRSQRRAVRHTSTRTHSQARLTRRAEMRAILALAQVLVAAAAAARSAERDAAPSTALMMVLQDSLAYASAKAENVGPSLRHSLGPLHA